MVYTLGARAQTMANALEPHPPTVPLTDAEEIPGAARSRFRLSLRGNLALGLLIALLPSLVVATWLSSDYSNIWIVWPGEEEARAGIMLGWREAHLIKASIDEIMFLTGEQDPGQGVLQLWHPGLELVVVTQGAKGCLYFARQAQGSVPGFMVSAIDTTGAGDGFAAGLLAEVLAHPHLWQEIPVLEKALRFANAVGALTTTRLGAIPALPDRQAVARFLRQHGRGTGEQKHEELEG